MERISPELALSGCNSECNRTDTVFLPSSGISEGAVSL